MIKIRRKVCGEWNNMYICIVTDTIEFRKKNNSTEQLNRTTQQNNSTEQLNRTTQQNNSTEQLNYTYNI